MTAASVPRRTIRTLITTASPLTISIAIFLLALVPRLLWVYGANTESFYAHAYHAEAVDYAAPPGLDDVTFYLQSAHSIAQGDGYDEPFQGTSTARYPPGWPFVLSIFDRVFGENPVPPATFNAVIAAATCVTTFLIGAKLFGRGAGVASALILALFPSHILFAPVLLTEILFAFLCSVVLLIALDAASLRRTVVIGALIGLSALVRGEAIFLPLGLLFVLRWQRIEWKLALRHAAVMLVVAVAVMAPWAVRNTVRFDTPAFLTTQTGVNLMLGRLPQGGAGPDFPAYFAVAARYRAEPEPQRQIDIERASYQKARERLLHHPLFEGALIPAKLRHLLQDDPVLGSDALVIGGLWRGPIGFGAVKTVSQIYYDLVLAGSVLCLVLLWRKRAVLPILAIPALWAGVFGFVFFGLDRYHMPLLPMFSIGAAAGWAALLRIALNGVNSLRGEPAATKA